MVVMARAPAIVRRGEEPAGALVPPHRGGARVGVLVDRLFCRRAPDIVKKRTVRNPGAELSRSSFNRRFVVPALGPRAEELEEILHRRSNHTRATAVMDVNVERERGFS